MPYSRLADDPGFRSAVDNVLSPARWVSCDYAIEELADIFPLYCHDEIADALEVMVRHGELLFDGDLISLP